MEGLGSCPSPCSHSIPFTALVAQLVKNPPAMRETWVRSLDGEDPLEKGKATTPYHSSMLAWVHGVAKSWTQLSHFQFSLSLSLLPTPPYLRQGQIQPGFDPRVHSPLTQQWHLHPREEQCWGERGQKCLAWAEANAMIISACQSLTQFLIHHHSEVASDPRCLRALKLTFSLALGTLYLSEELHQSYRCLDCTARVTEN